MLLLRPLTDMHACTDCCFVSKLSEARSAAAHFAKQGSPFRLQHLRLRGRDILHCEQRHRACRAHTQPQRHLQSCMCGGLSVRPVYQ